MYADVTRMSRGDVRGFHADVTRDVRGDVRGDLREIA